MPNSTRPPQATARTRRSDGNTKNGLRLPDTAPTIVAIIPLYNGAKFIERSLRSVLSQSLPASEVVVVDDGSRDDGPSIARDIAGDDPRVRIIAKPNGGQSSARNLGVAQSRGAFIAFLDQDDWWYPRHLERLVDGLADSPRFGWVYSDVDEYDAAGKLVQIKMLGAMSTEHPKRSLLRCIAEDMYIVPSAALISREAFESVGGFDERLVGYEDDDLFLRLFREGWENRFVDEALSAWRIHSGSASYSPRMAKSGMLYARKLLEQFPDDPARSRYLRRDLIAPRFIRVALSSYLRSVQANDWEGAKAALSDIDVIRPYLRLRQRAKLSAARPAMSVRPLAAMLAAVYPGLRRLF